MKRNMGNADRVFRLLFAVLLGYLWYQDTFTEKMGVIAMIIAALLFATSLISVCPVYSLFGFDTCAKKKTV